METRRRARGEIEGKSIIEQEPITVRIAWPYFVSHRAAITISVEG